MAKIKYAPLVEHLKSSPERYAQLYKQHEMQYGALDKNVFIQWIVANVEPVVVACSTASTDGLPVLFAAFYSASLEVLGSRAGLANEVEYHEAWKLCADIPHLMLASPAGVLRSLNSALVSMQKHQPDKVRSWISSMASTLHSSPNLSMEDFLNVGRIHAWLNGMAHLRSAAVTSFDSLPAGVKSGIAESFPRGRSLEKISAELWPGIGKPKFVKELGDFVGLGGGFLAPPIAGQSQGQIVLSDGARNYVLFADVFGAVLLPAPSSIVSDLQEENEFKFFVEKFGSSIVPFDDISSTVIIRNTLVVTRSTSHHFYLYGWT